MPAPRLPGIVLLLSLTACGDKETGSGTTGSSDTTGSSGTSGPTGTAGTDSGGTSTGTPTTGEPGACVDPSETDIGPAVAVTIRNDTAMPLFFPLADLCDPLLPFQVLDADDVVVKTTVRACEFSCETVLQGNCGCGLGCGTAPAVKIEPGGAHIATWSGVQWITTAVLAECVEGCEPECVARATTPAGTYTLRSTAYEAVTACEPCDCQAGPDGTCEVAGEGEGQTFTAEITIDYPGETAAEIVFGP